MNEPININVVQNVGTESEAKEPTKPVEVLSKYDVFMLTLLGTTTIISAGVYFAAQYYGF